LIRTPSSGTFNVRENLRSGSRSSPVIRRFSGIGPYSMSQVKLWEAYSRSFELGLAQNYTDSFNSQNDCLCVSSGRSKPQNTSFGLQNWFSGFQKKKPHCIPSIASSISFWFMLDLYSQNKHGRILMVLKNTEIYNISWLSLQIFHSNLFGKVLDKCLAGSLADADACRRAGRGRRKIARGRLRCGSKNGEYLSHGYFRWKKMRFIIIFWGGLPENCVPQTHCGKHHQFPHFEIGVPSSFGHTNIHSRRALSWTPPSICRLVSLIDLKN
jgi:hypothetical protein